MEEIIPVPAAMECLLILGRKYSASLILARWFGERFDEKQGTNPGFANYVSPLNQQAMQIPEFRESVFGQNPSIRNSTEWSTLSINRVSMDRKRFQDWVNTL